MQNFTYHCPTKVVFGKGMIAELSKLVPSTARVLLAYGQGSIKTNGVYDQVRACVNPTAEFSGIEPNPEYETLMKAVALCKDKHIDFILAVGGGSVIDGMKFVAAALNWTKTADPWDICVNAADPSFAPCAKVPLGCVLTLPATGTECNGNSVVSRRALGEKRFFGHITTYPVFSILDPDMILTLPPRQVTNGVVDAFVHVMEQYAGNWDMSAVGDEFSEGVLRVLATKGKEVALGAIAGKHAGYAARADFWWATTQGLNYILANGVRQCWATHMIGHELTAAYGLDHGQTLAIVLPALLRFEKKHRELKLVRMAQNVWGVQNAVDMAEECIRHIEKFFREVGAFTKMSEYGLDGKHFEKIAKKFAEANLAAEGNVSEAEVRMILNECL